MATDENQDFSSDITPNNQLNKYGFSSMQNCQPPMYPPIPMQGYFSPPSENPLQELQMMGFKEMNYTETSGSPQEPFGFELRLDGIDKVFTGIGVGKKKARKVAAQTALEYFYEATALPEGIKIKPHKVKPSFVHPMFQSSWAPMGQLPPGYRYPMPTMAQQYASMVSSVPMTPQTKPQHKETPFSILHERYPEAQVRNQSTTTITVGEHEFSVTVPGSYSQDSRMHASVAALKELEGMEFPEWDEKLERIIRNHKDPSSMVLHPVTLLLKEYGTRNVTFKHDTLSEPCIVSINDSGTPRVYSSPICSNKRQAKYEAALLAVKELNLDKKYPNILPYGQVDRKRKHQETSEATANDDVTQLGYSIQTSMGIDEKQKQDSAPIEEMTDSQSPGPTQLTPPAKFFMGEARKEKIEPEPEPVFDPENEPTPDKKSRMDPPENTPADLGSDSPPLERRQQESRPGGYTTRYPRGGGRNLRGVRLANRGHKAYTGGYRTSQRYF